MWSLRDIFRPRDRYTVQEPVYAFMATYPGRLEELKLSVKSLLPQVDKLFIYMNQYDAVPEFLLDKKIEAVPAAGLGDLRDNGKFYFLEKCGRGYYFTVDDDIIYPRDYVSSMCREIDRHQRKCIVGVHGVILDQPFTHYFSKQRTVFAFFKRLESPRKVNVLGTGTIGFYSDAASISLADFKCTGMSDIFFSGAMLRQGVELIALKRPKRWLVSASRSKGPSLYHEYVNNDGQQSDLVRSFGVWPSV